MKLDDHNDKLLSDPFGSSSTKLLKVLGNNLMYHLSVCFAPGFFSCCRRLEMCDLIAKLTVFSAKLLKKLQRTFQSSNQYHTFIF